MAAEEIATLSQSLQMGSSCPAVMQEFDLEATRIVEKYKAMDAACETKTNHGRSQGARFP